jgi:hypothetical protein
MSTAAQIAANQRNAQLSTGPNSEAGKSASSRNALKTGLTGRTVLLPAEDAALYETHVAHFVKRYEPVGDDERNLVQSLADTEWRLGRIPSLELGIYAAGRLEFADLFANEEEAVRKHLIEAKVFLSYQRQLNNLSIQEGRLRRQREKDSAQLKGSRSIVSARPKHVWIKPPGSTFRQSMKTGRKTSSLPSLGSNFHLRKSRFAPCISSLTCSPITNALWLRPAHIQASSLQWMHRNISTRGQAQGTKSRHCRETACAEQKGAVPSRGRCVPYMRHSRNG